MRTSDYPERQLRLSLSMVPGLGFTRLTSLISSLGLLGKVLSCTQEELRQVSGTCTTLYLGIVGHLQSFDLIGYQRRLAEANIKAITGGCGSVQSAAYPLSPGLSRFVKTAPRRDCQ